MNKSNAAQMPCDIIDGSELTQMAFQTFVAKDDVPLQRRQQSHQGNAWEETLILNRQSLSGSTAKTGKT